MRRRYRHRHEARVPQQSQEELLCRRAWRCRRRGDQRKAMLLLRQAAFANEESARIWTLYAVQCSRMGRREAARKAFGHAVWLRERNREHRRAAITRALLEAGGAYRAA